MSKFVLVPGAWLGSWAWKRVTPLLEAKGHDVYPVTLTGMGDRVHLATKDVGMETATQDVLNIIKFNELDDFVLVGHSFAGKVAATVADRTYDRVKRVVYLDSFRPQRVRTPQGSFNPAEEFGALPPGAFAFPLTEKTVDTIGSDVRGRDRKWLMSMATPWPRKLAEDPVVLSKNYDGVKESYVFCKRTGDPVDDIIAGKWGKLLGPHRVIDAGHWPMITRPKETADALVALSKG